MSDITLVKERKFKIVGDHFAQLSTGGPMFPLGDVTEGSFAISESEATLPNRRNPGGGSSRAVRRIDKVELSITLHDVPPRNLALGLFGTETDIAASSVTDEAITFWPDSLGETVYINPTVTDITSADGSGAGTWNATTAQVVGDFIVPTVANDYFYVCTTAGTTAGSEPTWPTTPGGTVTDGTVVWTCVGHITLVVTTDYIVLQAGVYIVNGRLHNATAGYAYNVDYTYPAQESLAALTASGKTIRLVLDGENELESDMPTVIRVHSLRLGPTADLQYLGGDDFGALTLTGTLEQDTTKTGTGESTYFEWRTKP